MKEDFDLDSHKKEMPYQVPAGFFEAVTQATLQEAKRRESPRNIPKQQVSVWKTWAVAASVSVLLVAGYFLWKGPQSAPVQLAQQKVVQPTPALVQDTGMTAATLPLDKALEKHAALPAAKTVPPGKSKKATKPIPAMEKPAPENLDNFLATLTDAEVAELAAVVASESYVYEETLL